MKRLVPVLLAGLALVLVAAGCGDDGGGDEAGLTTAQTQAETAPTPAAAGPDAEARKRRAARRAAARRAKRDAGQSTGAPVGADTPAASAPEERKSLYTPKDLEGFGPEAGGDDRSEAAATAEGYYAARAADDWERACDLLAADARKQLEEIYGQNPKLADKGCPGVLAVLVGGLPKELRQQQADETRFTTMRIDGDSALLFFESASIPNGVLPMRRDGDDWAVGAIAGSSL